MNDAVSDPGKALPVRGGKPTVRDVALRANVGISTVSRVLNRSSLVAADKTKKVLQVMQEIGYDPASTRKRFAGNRKGSGVPKLKFQSVCMLLIGHRTLRWITNYAPVYAEAIESVESSLRSMNVNCMIRNVQTPADLQALKRVPVDGFLIHGASDWKEWPDELSHYPGVAVLGLPKSGWGDVVTYNNESTGQIAASYLLSRGCRHAFIAGVARGEVFSVRRNAFTKAMTAAGATVSDLSADELMPDFSNTNLSNAGAVQACVDRMLQISPRPEGIFTTSDVVAPTIYRELERRGFAPGMDVQIVSCNNEKPYLSQLKIQPAVVDLQSGAIGARAVDFLLWRVQNREAPRQTLMIEPILHVPQD